VALTDTNNPNAMVVDIRRNQMNEVTFLGENELQQAQQFINDITA
jgi:hypothetical protein